FRPIDVEPFIGMTISEVIVYHAYAPMNGEGTLQIWDRGAFTTPGPGELIYEKEYSAPDAGQFTVSVDEDIYIDGKDLWVGYAITDPGDGVFPIGMDAGPQEPGVNYTSTGPGWSEMTGDDYGNIGVIVELVGDGIPTWMSVTPASGTIESGGSEEVLVDFNTSGLDNGVYEAQIHIGANDPENNYTPIPVTLDISTAIIDGNEEKIGVMTFPNPASENINIKANDVITSVKLINQIGQVVYENNGGSDSHAINVSNLEKGVYMVQVKTENSNITTQKVIVE
ncbi:MAG TPA: T9SS type A sorting domain-containing protein, partial [Bacteroidales bacterium]|nr:T9SS type A sorting domain-containing protein [Bacteroidales bacterium]